MVSQSSPSSARMASPCSLSSGARPGGGRLLVVLHRGGHELERDAVGGLAVLDVAVGHGLGIDRRPRACSAPRPTGRRSGSSRSRHSSRVRGGEDLAQDPDGLLAVGHERGVVGEARVGGQFGPADALAQRRPVLAGLQAGEGEDVAVLGLVVARQRVARRSFSLAGGRHGRSSTSERATAWPMAHRPDAEQRHVDGGGLAGALAVEQRAHDAAGDGHGADRVAEAGGGRHRHEVVLRALGAHGDARAGPEGQRVVGALVGVGAALALAGAPHVDDVRVVRPGSRRRRCAASSRTLGSLLVRKTSQVAASL